MLLIKDACIYQKMFNTKPLHNHSREFNIQAAITVQLMGACTMQNSEHGDEAGVQMCVCHGM